MSSCPVESRKKLVIRAFFFMPPYKMETGSDLEVSKPLQFTLEQRQILRRKLKQDPIENMDLHRPEAAVGLHHAKFHF
jgi:hypothetical protein